MPGVDLDADAPADFRAAVDSLRAVTTRPEVALHEIPPPQRLAPWSFVVSAEVASPEGDDIATGRLVLLHDPDRVAAWEGEFRLVTYVTAEADPEMTADPLFSEVSWDLLTESLQQSGAQFTAAGGTITRTLSTRFGDIAGPRESSDVEIRASWTPLDTDLGPHLSAWCDLLCTTAGLPPPGVSVLRRPSGVA